MKNGGESSPPFFVWKFGFTPIMTKKMLDKAVVISSLTNS